VTGADFPCALTVDVEDWFHSHNLKDLIQTRDWEDCESRVERTTLRILEILGQSGTRGTFFVLGWIAERYPGLVRRIAEGGHEVASHGYWHELVYSLTPDAFRADVKLAKDILEDILGKPVLGYRAPCFSITDWALPILKDLGHQYDSSFFPVAHDRYGRLEGADPERPICEIIEGFHEVAISRLAVAGVGLPWGGGGYFRLCPYPIWLRGIQRILASGSPYVFYIHPWEIDTRRPRIPGLTGLRAFRHDVGLSRCERRLRSLAGALPWCPVTEIVARGRHHPQVRDATAYARELSAFDEAPRCMN
jgi:polysaccharide deacetylase family protein (PEP-CTERM system associated)